MGGTANILLPGEREIYLQKITGKCGKYQENVHDFEIRKLCRDNKKEHRTKENCPVSFRSICANYSGICEKSMNKSG